MLVGQRFFMVKIEGLEPSFYGGLSEVARLYNLNYNKLTREVNREGKKIYRENGVEIKSVLFRIKN